MGFDKSWYACDQHPSEDRTSPSSGGPLTTPCHQESLALASGNRRFPLSGQLPSPVLEFPVSGLIQQCSSVSGPMPLRFAHAAAAIIRLSLFVAEWYFSFKTGRPYPPPQDLPASGIPQKTYNRNTHPWFGRKSHYVLIILLLLLFVIVVVVVLNSINSHIMYYWFQEYRSGIHQSCIIPGAHYLTCIIWIFLKDCF